MLVRSQPCKRFRIKSQTKKNFSTFQTWRERRREDIWEAPKTSTLPQTGRRTRVLLRWRHWRGAQVLKVGRRLLLQHNYHYRRRRHGHGQFRGVHISMGKFQSGFLKKHIIFPGCICFPDYKNIRVEHFDPGK